MSILNPTTPYSITGEQNQLVAGVVSVVAILAATVVYYALRPKADEVEHEFPKLRGIQLYHAWSFFERRYDFLHSNFERNPGKSFSFDILHHKVIALTGNDARHEFYSNPHLDLTEGYKILLGAVRLSPMQQQTVHRRWRSFVISDSPDRRRADRNRSDRARGPVPFQQEVE